MTKNLVQEELHRLLAPTAWHQIYYSPNSSKIEACNANMSEIGWDWEIVVLVSDDMIPQVKGWDDVIRSHMLSKYPDTDGLLWLNDGGQGDKLNTLCVYGRAMYNRLGYIYHPEYKSLFCDTELTDRCRGDLADKTTYVPYCIIRHEHPGFGYQVMDSLYAKNQRFWSQDLYTYIRRKAYPCLTTSLHEKMKRIAPDLRYEICLAFDSREMSVGLKRNQLLQGAKGKYMAFIDDDDEITDAYVEDLQETVRGEFPVMRLRGKIADYTFTHSLENPIDGMMARGDVFLRPPNHLNPMWTDVAKLVPFRDATRGEDLDWTIRLSRSGSLKREYVSDPSRLHYIYNLGQRVMTPSIIELQRQRRYDELLPMIWQGAGAAPTTQQARPAGLRLTAHGFVSK
jgi:hypothetical protein